MKFDPKDLPTLREKDPQLYFAILKKLEEDAKSSKEMSFLEGLSYHQKLFVFAESKRRAAICSRRAGKSHSIACWLLKGGFESPHQQSLYIAHSKAMARKIMMTAMEQINRSFDLGLKFHEVDGQLHVTLPNKHTIWLAGCKDAGEIDKFRGIYLKRVCIDEAQSAGSWMDELVNDVLEPALLDLDGEIALTGTPCPVPSGFFYEATTGDGNMSKWPVTHWTCVNNPYIQRKEEEVTGEMLSDPNHQNPFALKFLEEKRKANRWDDSNPTYRREWLGLWVIDRGALVYPCDPSKNYIHELPEPEDPKWKYAIGIDVGYVDDCAWTVVAYKKSLPTIYVVESTKRSKFIPSKVAVYTQLLMKKYNTSNVVIDAGGLGKGYQMEMWEKYGVFAENAKKGQKRGFQAVVAGEIKSGNIKFLPRETEPLIDEMGALVWEDEKRERESQELDNHACDSFLYIIRKVNSWYKPKFEESEPTRDQRLRKVVSEDRKRVAAGIRKSKRISDRKKNWARHIRDWKV